VRRTQLYLDDDLWKLLHVIARQSGATVSDLVRNAIREKYSQDRARRIEAFESIIGLWKDRTDIGETDDYIRKLRRSSRLERFAN
jgi:hypothetical protein